jgi:hypothetical protein
MCLQEEDYLVVAHPQEQQSLDQLWVHWVNKYAMSWQTLATQPIQTGVYFNGTQLTSGQDLDSQVTPVAQD